MKEKRKWRRPQAVDVLFFLGAALVSVGVACGPAGGGHGDGGRFLPGCQLAGGAGRKGR